MFQPQAKQLAATDDGCCRLSVASTTSLLLSPLNGNTLWIGGQACTIPGTGVTLSSPSVAASTLYYVYAMASGGAVSALVLSTTGHIAGSDGRQYLSSGGSTPSAVTTSRLVGMVYTNGSAQFADNGTNFRGCLNWFNRRSLSLFNPAQGQTSSGTYALVGNVIYGLTWGDQATQVRTTGYAYNNAANYAEQTINYVDGTGVGSISLGFASVANAQEPVSAEYVATLSEGIHTFAPFGAVTGGTGTWNAQQSVLIRG